MADEDSTLSSMQERLASAADSLKGLDGLSRQFGRSITGALSGGVVAGKSFDEVLGNLGTRLQNLALRAALRPAEQLVSSGLESVTKSLADSLGGGLATIAAGGTVASAAGNVFLHGRVRPFAAGGVVASPTYFPLAGGIGLMGERGAEAVMPLARGPDGRLGVAAGNAARPVSVNVQIAARDAESFRRSEAQVAAALARAVARGQRAS